MNPSESLKKHESSPGDSIEDISFLFNENDVTSFAPLYVALATGRSKDTPIVNLTTNFRKAVAYSCSHLVVMFYYEAQEHKFLYGHKNLITSLSSDGNGDFLVSSDTGFDNSIIVWETEKLYPVYTFQPSSRTYFTKISPNGEYIVSISTEGNYSVCCLWALCNERKDPDGTYMFDVNFGRVNDVTFSLNAFTDFMLTTKRTVLFFKWNYESSNPVDPEVCIPSPLPQKYCGQLSESLYLKGYPQSITSTSDGNILIWNDNTRASWGKKFSTSTCRKILEKWFHLQKDGITCLNQLDMFVVTGDSSGTIRFYDHNLCLLHWIQYPEMPKNLKQVEFHLQEETEEQKKKSEASLNVRTKYTIEFGEPGEKKRGSSARSSTSFYTAFPVDSNDIKEFSQPKEFIIVDGDGCVYLIDSVKNKQYILQESQKDIITTIDVHPESDKISLGNEQGHLSMVNANCQFIYTKSISDFVNTNERVITCIKYTSIGNHLAVGIKSGELFFVDSCLYMPKQEKPFHVSSTPISKICFSSDDSFMAHIDDINTVTLWGSTMDTASESEGPKWIYCGRVCPHYDIINCLTFDPYPEKINRLLSVGNDYSLVEYSLKLRRKEGLGILTRCRIEQSAYPLHISWIVNSSGMRCLLITNSEFKCKLYSLETKEYMRTFQSLVYDTPISFCHMLQQPRGGEVMFFATNKLIGLMKLPLDGNPYKSIGIMAHPIKLTAAVVSNDHKTVFSLGKNETCIIKWLTNTSALETLHKEGGEGLDPYYCMVDGGRDGWLFQQAIDHFYLAQLLHEGHLWKNEHIIKCAINTCELAHLMRSLGYFATNYEIQSMLHEVFCEISVLSKLEMDEIEFEEFIQLFLNHRSAKGITSDDLKIHFKNLSEGESSIPKDKLLNILKNRGERMSDNELTICINILLHDISWDENDCQEDGNLQLPEELTQNIIEDALLGIKNIEKEDEK